MRKAISHAELIELKGTAAIAEATGRSRAHVRVWKNRCIPKAAYAELMAAFPDVTLDLLKRGEPA